jgi:hypothetical protein
MNSTNKSGNTGNGDDAINMTRMIIPSELFSAFSFHHENDYENENENENEIENENNNSQDQEQDQKHQEIVESTLSIVAKALALINLQTINDDNDGDK